METDPNNIHSNQSAIRDYSSPWPVPQPCLATYIMLFFLAIVWPTLNMFSMIMGQYDINKELLEMMPLMFLGTILIQWAIVFLITLVLWREQAGLDSLGLVRFRIKDIFIGTGAFLFLNILFMIIQLMLQPLDLAVDESVNFMLERGSDLIGWWWAVSITAAICEEMTFRGFLMTRLKAVTKGGWFVPLLISSIVFGTGHAYQGIVGLVLLTLLGMLLGGLFLWTRSLWPAIIAHFIIDISAIYIYKISQSLGL